MKWEFESMAAIAEHFAEKARSIRSRVPTATRHSQNVMRAEAHAYEQCAMIVRDAVIAKKEAA